MKNILSTIFIVFCCVPSFCFSQKNPTGPEAAFLHTDKTYYQSGETIWFSLFLFNQPFSRMDLSSIGYLELYDPKGDLLARLKLKFSNGMTSGQITLPDYLPTGVYTFKPFTLWMQNFFNGDDFSKRILVFNPLDRVRLSELLHSKEQSKESNTLIGTKSKTYKLDIAANKEKFKTRERVEASIDLSHEKTPIKGYFSISVYEFHDSAQLNQLPRPFDVEFPPQRSNTSGINYPKEQLIFPLLTSSLESFTDFSKAQIDSNAQQSDTDFLHEKALLIQEIKKSYSQTEAFTYTPLKLPSDMTYYPADYEGMEYVADFLKEVVPQVKLLKGKHKGQMRIRNSENSQRIFFYLGNPLLVLDGYIIDKSEEILNMELVNIASIDIAWKIATINMSATSSLADNGIIALYTKTGSVPKSNQRKLYQGFHEPVIFTPLVYNRKFPTQGHIPDFRSTLYWNPSLHIEGNTKITFYTPDESGDYVIEIIGILDSGEWISERRKIQVDFR